MRPAQTASGETTRDLLVEASYRLFTQNGYHGTSMRDIAAAAGITAGSIYNHFSDKEQVIQAVILAYHPIARVLYNLDEVDGLTAEEMIRDAAHRLAQELKDSPGIIKLLFIEMVELGGRHITDLLQEMLPEAQKFVARVYGTGQILRPADPTVWMRAFLGMLIGFGITNMLFEPQAEMMLPPQSVEDFIEVFLWGVVDRPS
ncbi:MAG TPA: TetR/AcrR family transcriptional regulator, partial [Anaerolineaceae bacterium]